MKTNSEESVSMDSDNIKEDRKERKNAEKRGWLADARCLAGKPYSHPSHLSIDRSSNSVVATTTNHPSAGGTARRPTLGPPIPTRKRRPVRVVDGAEA